MSLAHRRQKRPDLIRHNLLDAALQIVVEEGPQAVTLDAVARRADVTKGGLQHHFPNKQALLDTLFDCLFHDFEGDLQKAIEAEPDTPGRHARAYIRLAFASHADTPSQRALLLLGLSWPPYAQRWRESCAKALLADGADPETADRLLLCRIAADGLWTSQITGSYALDEQRRDNLLQMLLRLCDGAIA
ncbi:MAG: TetR/AcrR family transcriptional regulator [Comamonadaceae bacterium]|nr:MAG: TetR/AcrR family transcriptional regulator [Comamonadaceae bacterium]